MWSFTKNIAEFANSATNNLNNLLDKLAGDDDDNNDNNENNNNNDINDNNDNEKENLSKDLPEMYHITKELKEFIDNICVKHPHTFVLFNHSQEGNDLDEYQINHATLILKECANLEHVRYKLCPKYTSEKAFWSIYFHILKLYNNNETFIPPSPKPIRRYRYGEISNRIKVQEEYCDAANPPVLGAAPSDSESIASDWRQEEPLSPTLSKDKFIVVNEEKLSTRTEPSSATISPITSPKAVLTDNYDDDDEVDLP